MPAPFARGEENLEPKIVSGGPPRSIIIRNRCAANILRFPGDGRYSRESASRLHARWARVAARIARGRVSIQRWRTGSRHSGRAISIGAEFRPGHYCSLGGLETISIGLLKSGSADTLQVSGKRRGAEDEAGTVSGAGRFEVGEVDEAGGKQTKFDIGLDQRYVRDN